MNFFKAMLVFLAMCAVLSVGVVLLVAGKPWLILLGMIAFVVLFTKYGCLAH